MIQKGYAYAYNPGKNEGAQFMINFYELFIKRLEQEVCSSA